MQLYFLAHNITLCSIFPLHKKYRKITRISMHARSRDDTLKMVLLFTVKVMVKCSQVGDRFVKRVAELSTPDDEPLTKNDLKCGTSLVADVDGCPYPVEVIGTVGIYANHCLFHLCMIMH